MTTRKQIDDLSPTELKDFLKRGILEVMSTQPIPTCKEETPEYRKHAALAGQPIHVSAAAREYHIPQQTISHWVQRGLIKILGMNSNKKLLDWADVAYCAEVYHTRKQTGIQGKWIFDDNGLPYVKQGC